MSALTVMRHALVKYNHSLARSHAVRGICSPTFREAAAYQRSRPLLTGSRKRMKRWWLLLDVLVVAGCTAGDEALQTSAGTSTESQSVPRPPVVVPLLGHLAGVNSVAYSADGQWIASGSIDGTVRVWSAVDGTEAATLRGHTDWVRGVAFSPGGDLAPLGLRQRRIDGPHQKRAADVDFREFEADHPRRQGVQVSHDVGQLGHDAHHYTPSGRSQAFPKARAHKHRARYNRDRAIVD